MISIAPFKMTKSENFYREQSKTNFKNSKQQCYSFKANLKMSVLRANLKSFEGSWFVHCCQEGVPQSRCHKTKDQSDSHSIHLREMTVECHYWNVTDNLIDS